MTERELILTSILNCTRSELYLNQLQLKQEEETEFNSLIEQRKHGQPLQYLLGYAEFMGLRLKVDSRALIPRPETEIVVEETINTIKDLNLNIKSVLDIGTGTGNIAISIAKFLPSMRIAAVDISPEALSLAKENAILNKVKQGIDFLKADILDMQSLVQYSETFDLIISNPPYIKTDDLAYLPKDVGQEPRIALDGGSDGLKFYGYIIQQAQKLLKKQGLLVLEIGYNQSKPITKMLQENKLTLIKIIPDYSGIQRVVIARLR